MVDGKPPVYANADTVKCASVRDPAWSYDSLQHFQGVPGILNQELGEEGRKRERGRDIERREALERFSRICLNHLDVAYSDPCETCLQEQQQVRDYVRGAGRSKSAPRSIGG